MFYKMRILCGNFLSGREMSDDFVLKFYCAKKLRRGFCN